MTKIERWFKEGGLIDTQLKYTTRQSGEDGTKEKIGRLEILKCIRGRRSTSLDLGPPSSVDWCISFLED